MGDLFSSVEWTFLLLRAGAATAFFCLSTNPRGQKPAEASVLTHWCNEHVIEWINLFMHLSNVFSYIFTASGLSLNVGGINGKHSQESKFHLSYFAKYLISLYSDWGLKVKGYRCCRALVKITLQMIINGVKEGFVFTVVRIHKPTKSLIFLLL